MAEPAAAVSLTIYQVIMIVGIVIAAFWVLHMAIVNHKINAINDKIKGVEDNVFSKLREVNSQLEGINTTITEVHTLYHDLDKQVAVSEATKQRGKDA
jgi:uncharacterized membrane protein